MRVLVLASYVPSLYKGAEIRLYQLLRHLSEQHEVTLWAINQRGVPAGEIQQLLPHCRLELQNIQALPQSLPVRLLNRSQWWRENGWQLGALFQSLPNSVYRIYRPELQKRLNHLLTHHVFDLVHLNQVMIWHYLARSGRDNLPPVLLCTDNAWAELARRDYEASPKHPFPKKREAKRMAAYEQQAVAACDGCVVVSEVDKRFLQTMAADKPFYVVPNGVDTDYFAPAGNESPTPHLVFSGAMGWQPNAEAMIAFCHHIFPAVLAQHPTTQLTIVGLQPPPAVRQLANQANIHVTGFVPDVRPYIAAATVYIAPLRLGSGTRLKILEALAMGKAVVSTTIGAEGLAVTAGRELLIADDNQTFAQAISHLLANAPLRHQLGQAGRQLVTTHYHWQTLASQLDTIYRSYEW